MSARTHRSAVVLVRGLNHQRGTGNVALRRDAEPELSKFKALIREGNGGMSPT